MDQEKFYLASIEEAESFQIIGDRLEISHGETWEILTFVANRTPLEDTQWKLISHGSVTEPQAPFEGTEFTARFLREALTPSGFVEGSTGCNDYNATYTANLTEIKVNLPQKTRNSCIDGILEMEQAYFLALNSARDYRILGNTLQIPYDSDRQALNFIAVPPPVEPVLDLSPLQNSRWWLVSQG
ncbi:MAG: META domain-containing protein, partial [Gammaproteobacteria bacterium]|nr:META domain-containing protein [Gammaproteobacteria bacterium]